MAFLEYYVEGLRQEAKLEHHETSIGRSPDCRLQLLHDAELSRHHCSILRDTEGTYAVLDHGATNGTFLNDKRLTEEPVDLTDGDRIRIGKTVMTFRDQEVGHMTKLFGEVADEMNKGAGFHTIMHRILGKESQERHADKHSGSPPPSEG